MMLLFHSHEGGSYSDYFSDTYHYAYDWLSGSLDNCPFRDNMMESIKHKYVLQNFPFCLCNMLMATFLSPTRSLERHIRGQNEGLDTILSAISAWEFQRQSGQSEPLVLALTGPTGVGKSETSFRLAEGALGKRSKVGKSLKYRPNGLLALRGEDYTEGSLAVVPMQTQFINNTLPVANIFICTFSSFVFACRSTSLFETVSLTIWRHARAMQSLCLTRCRRSSQVLWRYVMKMCYVVSFVLMCK